MEFRIQEAIRSNVTMMSQLESLVPQIKEMSEKMIDCVQRGGKIFWMGNGGSAAQSQHLAAELVGRFEKERAGIASLALTTDTSILTALGNDYHFDIIFKRQIEALCQTGDMVIGLSTSGKSKNILEALRLARKQGAFTVGLTGKLGESMKAEVDLCLCVPEEKTSRIQEAHLFVGHMVCELVEAALA